MPNRQDFIKECNQFGVEIQEFSEQFCNRCFNSECARSQAGSSKFEQRVNTWEERLFLNPPKLPKGDARYSQITAKRWREAPQGPIQIQSPTRQSAWIDPKDLDEPVEEPQIEPDHDTETDLEPVTPPPQPPAPEPVRPPAEAVPEPDPEPEPKPEPTPRIAAQLMNTPYQGPQMLKGHQEPKKEEKDPWAAPKATSSGDEGEIVEPGAKIRLGQ